MEQRKRHRTAESAGTAGYESYFAAEFAGHEMPPCKFYTLIYTSDSVECLNHKEILMPTNLAIDDRLIAEAQKVGHHRTKKEAVTAALDEYIRKRKQLDILEMFGKVDFDENYDYKRERERKPKHR
jgi:Arc/MetJ family transcription regulator